MWHKTSNVTPLFLHCSARISGFWRIHANGSYCECGSIVGSNTQSSVKSKTPDQSVEFRHMQTFFRGTAMDTHTQWARNRRRNYFSVLLPLFGNCLWIADDKYRAITKRKAQQNDEGGTMKHATPTNPLCHLFCGWIKWIFHLLRVMFTMLAPKHQIYVAWFWCELFNISFPFDDWMANSSPVISIAIGRERIGASCCFNCALPSSVIHCIAIALRCRIVYAIKMDGN